MTALTASAGWVLIASSPGTYRITLGSQGPVWLSGVVTEAPDDDDFSTYVIEDAGSLDFTLATDDELYARANRNQTVTATELPAATGFEAIAASVDALTALFGSDEDEAGDPTVFGLAKQVAANTEAPEIPEWVPENATDFVNFTSNQSWDGGEGVASAVCGGDVATETSWDESEFSLAQLSEDGYEVPAGIDGFVLLGDTLERIKAGSTLVFEWVSPASGENSTAFALANEAYSNGISIDVNLFNNTIYGYGNDSGNDATSNANVAEGTPNKLAVTITESRVEWSINGDVVFGFDPEPEDWGEFDYFYIRFRPAGTLIKSIAVYEPQATAALPALSALV